jgi:hypothetical protein
MKETTNDFLKRDIDTFPDFALFKHEFFSGGSRTDASL